MKRTLLILSIVCMISSLAFSSGGEKKEKKAVSDKPMTIQQLDQHLNTNILKKLNKAKVGETNSCLTCHETMSHDSRIHQPVIDYKGSIHDQKGLHCVECHGGDSTKAGMDAMGAQYGGENNFIGKPSEKEILISCARCHADKAKMEGFGSSLRTDQLELYQKSTHGKINIHGSGGAAACSNCHNPHKILPKTDPESTVFHSNVANTCGQCHPQNKDFFNAHSKHKEYFANNQMPQCVQCHSYHDATRKNHAFIKNKIDFKLVEEVEKEVKDKNGNVEKKKVKVATPVKKTLTCESCHSPGELESKFGIYDADKKDKYKKFEAKYGKTVAEEQKLCTECHNSSENQIGYEAFNKMADINTHLTSQIKEAEGKLNDALHKGMSVKDPMFKLDQLKKSDQKALITMHHKGNLKEFEEKYNEIKASGYEVVEEADAALKEFEDRKSWAAIATLVILFFIIVLVLFIREIESKKKA